MDRLKKIIDSSTWVIFFASVIFSLMTVAAQNSIPGDSLYGFKLGYEKVMLASSKFLNKQVDVQIEFVARRFSETTQVLSSKYGSESLNRLNEEVDSTAYTITLIEDPAERKAAAKKYVAQLNVISTGLGQQKQNFVNPTSTTNPQTNTNANTTTYNPTDSPSSTSNAGSVTKITPTKTPTPAPVQEPQIVEEIDDTQQNIEEVIKEMEDIVRNQVAPVPTNTPVPTATPVPPTPTTQPTVVPTEVPTATPTESIIKRAADFCEKHPDKCDNNSDTNNNVIENNQEEND